VVAFYEGRSLVPTGDPMLWPFGLDPAERRALVSYLKALTHEGVKVAPPRLP
jgi:hypothetical protein